VTWSPGEADLLRMLSPQLAGLDVDFVEDTGQGLRIAARTRTASLACRGCGQASSRVHDRYVRCLRDLPCGGRPVEVALQVRRFCCPDRGCPAATFAEQVTGWYQRRTAGLRGWKPTTSPSCTPSPTAFTATRKPSLPGWP
jgi:transposase